MSNKGEALKPDKFFGGLPVFIQDERAEPKGVSDEEQILAAGSETIFWATLKAIADKEILTLDEMNTTAIEGGAPLEEIGRNTVVISLTKGTLKRIFDRVIDAKDATEHTGDTGQPGDQ